MVTSAIVVLMAALQGADASKVVQDAIDNRTQHIQRSADSAPVVFAFTSGDYIDYKDWHWESITHLGFWSKPSDDVRALAKQHNVKLFTDAGVPDKKDWLDKDKVKAYVSKMQDKVKDKNVDGLFFDFEGTALSKAEKKGYTALASAVAMGIKSLNASLMVCVGGRPTYENRDYDYSGLADATDFLFIMGYDLHLYDDYTCGVTSQGNVCSPAEASIRSLTAGVEGYLKSVPANKLVLGLPWYGQRYTQIAVPINEGQIDYSDVIAAFDDGIVTKKEKDKDSLSWKIDCKGACLKGKGKKGDTVWYDDAETLAPKFALAGKHKLRGVGVWTVDKLPTASKHADLRADMWTSLENWNS